MNEDRTNTRVPLNSPLYKSANPSYRKQKLRESKYKVPNNSWMPGNSILRRYANGQLDYDYAASKIFECMDKLRDGGTMLPGDQALLSLVMPGMEKVKIPGAMAATMIKLSDEEKMKLRLLVSAQRSEMLNWNAGLGGGSTPMRTTSTS